MQSTQHRSINITIPGIGIIEASAAAPLPAHLRPLIKQDDRQKFWINRQWPEDAFGKVFLARAAIRVGEAMFPEDWTGHEPGVDMTLAPLPMFPSQAPNWVTRQALEAVPMKDRVPVLERLAARPSSTIDQRDWDKAVHLRQLVLAELEAPRARWAAAQHRLREAMKMEPMEVGAVKYHVLDAVTGDYSGALSNKWWNTTANWQARFYWCKINLSEPITASVGGQKFQWIFVDGADLDRLLQTINPKAAASEEGKNLIPHQKALEAYLEAAVAASPHKRTLTQRMDIDPWRLENAPSITERCYREIRSIVLSWHPGNKWGKVKW